MTVQNNQNFLMPMGAELDQLVKFAEVMGNCPFYRKLGAGGVLSIYLSAKELGLPFMQCLNGGMHNVEGRVTLSAQMMNTLVLNAGHKLDILESNEQICRLMFHRKDRTEGVEYSYTIEEARKAGYLHKNNWKSHLKDMLFCRALSGGARKICPDAIGSCYVQGEMGDDVTPVMPYEETPKELPEKKEEPKQLGFQKVEGFDEFIKNNGLDEDSQKAKYVMAIVESSSNTRDEIINFAVNNPDRFEAGFQKWSGSKSKDSAKNPQ